MMEKTNDTLSFRVSAGLKNLIGRDLISDKYIEVIVRQLTNKVTIVNPGDSSLFIGKIETLCGIIVHAGQFVIPKISSFLHLFLL